MNDIKHDMFLGADGYLFEKARQLRNQETKAEKLLWSKLCKNQLGVRFRRQHPIYSYVVDFYCHSHKLIIEVDGPEHETEEGKFNDNIRSQAFKEFDIEILRFTNNEVLFDIETVLQKISIQLSKHTS